MNVGNLVSVNRVSARYGCLFCLDIRWQMVTFVGSSLGFYTPNACEYAYPRAKINYYRPSLVPTIINTLLRLWRTARTYTSLAQHQGASQYNLCISNQSLLLLLPLT